jgi:hypothetical protein
MLPPYRLVPIPVPFFQESEKVPFTNCTLCDREFDDETMYVIEKAFQTYLPYKSRDLVFEYAICMECYEGLSDSFSEESSRAMQQYIDARVDFSKRAKELFDTPFEIDHWLSSCAISGKPVDELDGYQFVGVFVGDQMIASHTPCLISAEVVGEIGDLLSKKTLDILGGFAQEVMPQPPGFEKDLPTPALVL